MKSIRFLDRRLGYSLASIGMMLGIAAPSVIPTLASADQLDQRSITLSSSTKGAQDVTYKIVFTPSSHTADGVVINFCNDSPIPGTTCTAPAGLDLTNLDTSDVGATATAEGTHSVKYVPATPLATGSAATINLTGITNPSAATTASTGFYARILTYDSAFTGYTDEDTVGTPYDEGGIAMAITEDIGVSAAVLETLTFCVSASTIGTDCSGVTTPNIVLGQGTPVALSSDRTDTADVYTQLSTNAAHGAVVNMKNSNDCGGLKRFGATGCDIAPANGGNAIAAGTAMFGMKAVTTTGITVDPDYAFTGSNYGMNYPGANQGVTSAYGDQIYSSTGPVNNADVPLTFAASISNDTPAGLYTANMNLVATGTY